MDVYDFTAMASHMSKSGLILALSVPRKIVSYDFSLLFSFCHSVWWCWYLYR